MARSGAPDQPGAPAERARPQAAAERPQKRAAADRTAADRTAAGQAAAGQAAAGQAARLPYEQARDELTDLVKRLEAGGLTLEQSLELWERGERLADICTEWLEGARARLATAMARRNDTSADPAAPF
jgi:exodeoxyribonuclease VII small subunit